MVAKARFALTARDVQDAVYRLEGERVADSTLAFWAIRGWVTPSVQWKRRRGRHNPRIYSLADVVKARLLVRLRREGVEMRHAADVIAFLDAHHALKPGAAAVIVVDRHRAVVRLRGVDQEVSGQLVMGLDQMFVGVEAAARAAQEAA